MKSREWLLEPEDIVDFAQELRPLGYSVGVAEYVAAQRLILLLAREGAPNLDRRSLATWLAPIFCCTPVEQENFYKHFDQWLKLDKPSAAKAPDQVDSSGERKSDTRVPLFRRLAPWQWIAVTGAACFLIAGGVFAVELAKRSVPHPLTGNALDLNGHAVEGAQVYFKGQKQVTGPDGSFAFRVRLYDLPNSLVAVSAPSQGIPAEAIVPVDSKNFDKPQKMVLQPSLDAQILRSVNQSIPVSAVVVVPSPDPPWLQTLSQFLPWIRLVLVTLPIAFLMVWLFWVYFPRLQLNRWSTRALMELERMVVRKLKPRLFGAGSFRKTIQELRRHRPVGPVDLDAERTVKESAQKAGWVTPVYSPRQALPSYVVLIDRIGYHDIQTRFVEELVLRFKVENVPLDRYYFCSDARFCQTDPPRATPLLLQDIAAVHAGQTLLIFSDAAGMFSSLSGRPHTWIDLFSAWPERIIFLLDDPHMSRGVVVRHSQALQDFGFKVLPATQDGIARLAEIIHTGISTRTSPVLSAGSYPDLLLEDPMRWLDRLPLPPSRISRLLGQVRSYLGPTGFYWLAACAVYPQLNWELILYFGDCLGISAKDHSLLAKLCNLPWLRHGRMPDWLREQLVISLPPDVRGRICQNLKRLLLTALEKPQIGIALEIGRAVEASRPWISRWRELLLLNFVRTEPSDSPLRDYILVSFLYGRKPSIRAVEVPKPLRDFLRRYAQPRRPFLQVAAAFLMAGATAYGIGKVQISPISPLVASSRIRPPQPPTPNPGTNNGPSTRPATSNPSANRSVVVPIQYYSVYGYQFQDVFFDYGTTAIRRDQVPILTKIASAMQNIYRSDPTARIVLESHTDERGSTEFNLMIGDKQAGAVKNFLVANGVPASMLQTISFGKEKPFCVESNEQCWAQNRRVRFIQEITTPRPNSQGTPVTASVPLETLLSLIPGSYQAAPSSTAAWIGGAAVCKGQEWKPYDVPVKDSQAIIQILRTSENNMSITMFNTGGRELPLLTYPLQFEGVTGDTVMFATTNTPQPWNVSCAGNIRVDALVSGIVKFKMVGNTMTATGDLTFSADVPACDAKSCATTYRDVYRIDHINRSVGAASPK